ncbi:MAG: hypothetical protein AUG74_15575 [Bacteroidetes bacterium 13_1_20CM_4_60_6]|nr:MAG: hypothetical protein AUG74_15575 [Bacteroidetes bacterium 13_1_20CM_4_60_6]
MPELVDTNREYQSQIKGSTAGLLIGDRALSQRSRSKYIYDLGEAWKDHTQLSFVFAAWVSNKKLPAEFVDLFNRANANGLEKIDEIVAANPSAIFDLKKYFTQYISYRLDEKKKKGMKLFLEKISS